MKNLILLFTIALLASCSESSMLVTGKIENGLTGESIVVSIPYLDIKDSIGTVNDNGEFAVSFPLEEPHLGFLKIGDISMQIFCKPKAEMHCKIDYQKVKSRDLEGIILSGKNFEGSEVLKKIMTIRRRKAGRQLMTLSQKEFLEEINYQTTEVDKLIEEYTAQFPEDVAFLKQVELSKLTTKAGNYSMYSMYHKMLVPTDTIPFSDEILNYKELVPLNDFESVKENPTYKRYVVNTEYSTIMESIKAKSIKGDSKEYFDEFFNEIKAKATSQEIKDELVHNITLEYTYLSEEAQEVIKTRFEECEKKEEYIAEFNETLATLETIEKGKPSPKFEYPDIEGKIVKLDDLKGKLVYIDVWATWCGPCKGEIPHLKKLEKEFHGQDIEFVSISVDTNKEAWEKMVKEKELEGIQLHAKEAWGSDIVKKYAINGIPRFILLDKDGNIIDSNCSRPSDPKTKEKIMALLK